MLKDESDVWVYKTRWNKVTAVWWSCCCLWTLNIVYPHKSRLGWDGKHMAWPPLKVLNSMKIPLLGAAHLMGCERSLFPHMLEQNIKISTGATSYYVNNWWVVVELKLHISRISVNMIFKLGLHTLHSGMCKCWIVFLVLSCSLASVTTSNIC